MHHQKVISHQDVTRVTLKYFFGFVFFGAEYFFNPYWCHFQLTPGAELHFIFNRERERNMLQLFCTPTHDKQLILIYASPSLSHIKLRLHYGQWQVTCSKPDGIWRRPRDARAEVLFFCGGRSAIRCRLTPSPPSNCCGGKRKNQKQITQWQKWQKNETSRQR